MALIEHVTSFVFSAYALVAVLIGLLVKRAWAAFVTCLGVGGVVCVFLYYWRIYIEMGGLFHAWAFAGFSLLVWKMKKVWIEHRRPK